MDVFQKMLKQVESGFSTMSEESLILVLGGSSQQLSATGSCGSSGSSSSCDATSVCNCKCPAVPKPYRPIVTKPVTSVNPDFTTNFGE